MSSSTRMLVGIATVALPITYIVHALMQHYQRQRRYAALLNKAISRHEQKSSARTKIHAFIAPYLPPPEEQARILAMSAEQVITEMKTVGNAKVVMATTIARAICASERLECTADELFEDAMRQAIEADEKFQRDPTSLPALHGLPVSVKDCIDIKGFDSTCGILAFLDSPRPSTANVVQVLLHHGAIIITRTNLSQGLMVPESASRCWGITRNPYHRERTAGGSSGGDAALIAAKGSYLGLGTDIGGSIRIPAHFCGVVGFKPTPERVSRVGVSGARIDRKSGQTIIRGVVGPLARTVRDVILYLDLLWRPDSPNNVFDAYMPPNIGMDHVLLNNRKPLRMGVITQASFFTTSTACERAVNMVKRILVEEHGHVLVSDFTLPDLGIGALSLYARIMSADGMMHELFDVLDGEPLIHAYKASYVLSALPMWLRPMLAKLLHIIGEHRAATILPLSHGQTTYEHWCTVREVLQFRQAFMQAMMTHEIDVLILPGGTLPAFQHGISGQLLPSCLFTSVFNVLHMPAGTVPVTVVQPGEDVYDVGNYGDRMDMLSKKALHGSEGLPIGVQVVSMPWKDEVALRVMKEIDESIAYCKSTGGPSDRWMTEWPIASNLSVVA